MITKFKIYEAINIPLKKGDYVKINGKYFRYENVFEFFKDNIGQVIKIQNKHGSDDIEYVIQFENIPGKYKFCFNTDNTLTRDIKHIECWSENKEELEVYINSKKYNL